MEDAFIGQKAIEIQMRRLQKELQEIEGQIAELKPVYQLTANKEKGMGPLLNRGFVRSIVPQRQEEYLRTLEIHKELEEIDEALSHLDIFWLDEQRKMIRTLEAEIAALRRQGEGQKEKQGNLGEKVRQLEEETFPEF